MKKTIVMMAGISFCLISASVSAQQNWEAKKNPTVDSINAKHAGKLITTQRPAVTIDQIYPAIGQYQSSVNMDATSVSITPDEQSKGVVWITGIPQGKVKAMLKRSPATYRIPPQTLEDGKEVAEGTLIFDNETKTLQISIGKRYNEVDPASVFLPQPVEELVEPDAKVKSDKVKGDIVKIKSDKVKIKTNKVEPKPWMYSGTKLEKSTASNQ
jgi:hypothetical protein